LQLELYIFHHLVGGGFQRPGGPAQVCMVMYGFGIVEAHRPVPYYGYNFLRDAYASQFQMRFGNPSDISHPYMMEGNGTIHHRSRAAWRQNNGVIVFTFNMSRASIALCV